MLIICSRPSELERLEEMRMREIAAAASQPSQPTVKFEDTMLYTLDPSFESDWSKAQDEVLKLRQELDTLRKTCTAQAERLAQLQAQRDDYEAKVNRYRNKHNEFNSRLADKEVYIKNLKTENKELREEIGRLTVAERDEEYKRTWRENKKAKRE